LFVKEKLAYIFSVAFCAVFVLGGNCGVNKFDNPNFVPNVPDPRYVLGTGPIVGFDQAHQNHQGLISGFAALASLAEADGFRVEELSTPFDETDYTGTSVIIHALPGVPASEAESSAIWDDFVHSGGGFLGITDHPGHPEVMADLAAQVGVYFANTTPNHDGTNCSPPLCPQANLPAWYAFAPGLLGSHPITPGVSYVQTYNGSAILAWAGGAVSILTFGSDAIDRDTGLTIEGASRLVCGTYGAGRYCFSSEVQFLTSKCGGSCANRITGFDGHVGGALNAEFNELLARQMILWLDNASATGGE
jgi:hypothetical protein